MQQTFYLGERVFRSLILRIFKTDPDAFLKRVSGVIHVGANSGPDRHLYAKHGLDVVWIEPIPDVFARLQMNVKRFPDQKAYRYLVTDKDSQTYEFHIATNEGHSSSILEMNLHKKLYPDVSYTGTIMLESITLASLARKEALDMNKYDALVMDTQGTELLVLKGAVELLPEFTYIKTEVADFESYRGCCQVDDIDFFLKKYGFRECYRKKIASQKGIGSYYNIVYKRAASP